MSLQKIAHQKIKKIVLLFKKFNEIVASSDTKAGLRQNHVM
jgi:hypothetical protein